MKHKIGMLAAVLAAALALPASASVVVLGGGLAHDCFIAAASGSDSRDARETCTKALDHEGLTAQDRAATLVNRGILFLRSGAAERALRDHDLAIRIRPELAEAHLNRGGALLVLGRDEEARDSLDTSLRLEPAQPEIAHFNRALARENLGDVRGAYEDLKAALALKPDWELAQREFKRYRVTAPGDEVAAG